MYLHLSLSLSISIYLYLFLSLSIISIYIYLYLSISIYILALSKWSPYPKSQEFPALAALSKCFRRSGETSRIRPWLYAGADVGWQSRDWPHENQSLVLQSMAPGVSEKMWYSPKPAIGSWVIKLLEASGNLSTQKGAEFVVEFGLIGCSQVLATPDCAGNFSLGTLWVAQSLSLVGTTLSPSPTLLQLMWRRAVTARLHVKLEEGGARRSLVVLCSFYLNSTPFQVQVEEPWPLLVWAQMPLHSIWQPIHTQFYRARSPYDYCDCKCGRICRGSSRWVPFSTIFRQTQMLDVNWCGCIHERLKFRRWKSCENLWVSNGFYPRSFWMTTVHGNIGNGKWMAGYLLSLY